MPDALQPITSANAPRYRYYMVDIVTNKIVGEIPLEDVSYERSLKQPGSFEGKLGHARLADARIHAGDEDRAHKIQSATSGKAGGLR